MITASGYEKIHKHDMKHSEFELDHYKDLNYPSVESHYHDFYEILYFISGNVDFIIGDEMYHLEKGDLLFIPPQVFHNPIFTDFQIPYERYVLWVSAATLHEISKIDPDLCFFLHKEAPKRYLLRSYINKWNYFRSIFTSVEDALSLKLPLHQAQVKAFIMQLLVDYNRALIENSTNVQQGIQNTLLTNILHYIQAHIAHDLSLDTVSGIFFMDKFNFSHLFKEKMGISYYQYVLQQRLLLAKKLLLKETPAGNVCLACGFNDYSSFFRAFKKEYGISPNRFKKSYTETLDI